MQRLIPIGTISVLVLGFCGAPAVPAAAAEKVDFVKQILPILEQKCFSCHGAKKQKGKLRLDSPEAILKGEGDDRVVIPGKADESELYDRIILPADDDDIMPADGDPLSKAEQDLIRDWINQGAEFGDFKGVAEPEPKEPDLLSTLKAPKADPAALEGLNKLGALAIPVASDTNLIMVNFRNVDGVDKPDGAPLAQLKAVEKQVTWLSLANSGVTDDGLAHLASLTNLTRLHLERTKVTDAGLAHLKGLEHLEYLNLYGTGVTDAGLATLKGLKNLKKLYLWQTKVTDAGATDLKKALPELYVNRGWEGLPATQPAKKEEAAKKAAAAINAKCPLTDKPIDAAFVFAYKDQKIGFCCGNCRDKFAKEPDKFIAKVKEFKAN